MTDGIEAVTTSALGLALDAASLEQRAIATNIANAGSVDYTPVAVDFEAQLEDARRALETRGQLDRLSLAGVEPRLRAAAPDASGMPPKVQLDLEMAAMAQNSVRYQALVKALSKHFATLSASVSEGKR